MDVGVLEFLILALYFLPGIYASYRSHPSAGFIWLIDIFLGWTVIGWLVAAVWASRGFTVAPSPDTHVKCPDCAELVLKEAKVCKHCGCRLTPQPI